MCKKKNPPPLQWVMYGEILILVSLLLMMWGLENLDFPSPENPQFSQTQTKPSPDDWSEQTAPTNSVIPPVSTKPSTPFHADTSNPAYIQTPYGVLVFPEGYGDYLQATAIVNAREIQYFADFGDGRTQKIFAIRFGGTGDDSVGTANGTPVYVQVALIEGEWSQVQLQTIYAMQEELNGLLHGILDGAPQNPEEFLPVDDGTSLVVETPYGNLRFPSRWKDYLALMVDDGAVYTVTFACKTENHGNQPLFVVCFGGDQGIKAGIIRDAMGKETAVLVDFFDFSPDSSWSYQEKALVTTMQEDINYLIQNLSGR